MVTYNISGFNEQILNSATGKKAINALETTDVANLSTAISFLSYGVNYDIANTDWGKTNYQLSTLFLPNSGAMSVDMISSLTVIQGEKLVSNVTGLPNKVTLLSGNLFGGTCTTSTGGFRVSADTTMGTPIVQTFP